MDKLLFGTAGIPIRTKGMGIIEGIRSVREMGLGALELEFVRQINIRKENAPEVRKIVHENNIVLTCHGPYWINLNAKQKQKMHASMNYVLNSARITHMCGGWSICFHAAYYMGMEKPQTYENVKNSLKSIVTVLKNEGVKIWIRPEYGGKTSQFGDIGELVKISQDVEMVMPCIDFGHVYARSLGTLNNYEKFSGILGEVEKGLGREALENMHIHMAGVTYGKTGERFHTNLRESNINHEAVVKVWKDFRIRGVVISESPNIEGDAMLLKNVYENI